MKHWIATGIPEVDETLQEKYSPSEIITYAEGMLHIQVNPDDLVILSEYLQVSNGFDGTDDEQFLKIISVLRRTGVRICFFGTYRDKKSSFVKELIARGVYDFIFNDSIDIQNILDMLEHPKTYQQIAHYLDYMEPELEEETVGERLQIVSRQDITPKTEEQIETVEKRNNISSLLLKQRPRQSKINKQEESNKSIPSKPRQTTTIYISGVAGTGISFITLNLGYVLADRGKRVAVVDLSIRPSYTTWVDGPLGNDGVIRLGNDSKNENGFHIRENMKLYTVDPFHVQEKPNIKRVLSEIKKMDYDVILVDIPLNEFANIETTSSILVTTNDLFRCKWIEGLSASIIVMNMTKRLPLDIEEYKKFWPNSKTLLIPFTEGQSVATVTGVPLVKRSDEYYNRFQKLGEQFKN